MRAAWRFFRQNPCRVLPLRRFSNERDYLTEILDVQAPVKISWGGADVVLNPLTNKGTGFSWAERDRLGIRGLVPACEYTLQQQADRLLKRFRDEDSDMKKWIYLQSLMDRNETLYYKLVIDNIKEMAPIIYTPTVGEAAIYWSNVFRRSRGMYFTAHDRGHMSTMVYNWPRHRVDVVVVTDGSRILGLGDLGVNGMAIPVGKLALYVAAGGISPGCVLPVTIDVGTNNKQLLEDPGYLGIRQPRLTGREFFDIVDEFMLAIRSRWPNAVIQFEDFNNENAYLLLRKYREQFVMFNDDIQGTGSVVLAGVLSALRVQKKPFSAIRDQKIVCLGAGSAGIGVCSSIHQGMVNEGLASKEAYKQFWVLDKDGLLTRNRTGLTEQQLPFSRGDAELKEGASLLEVVRHVKPTILLGLCGVGATFTQEIIEEMSRYCDRPIIFPLSNPTKKAECTAQQAFEWSDGRGIVATGSPFGPSTYKGRTFQACQGNNMFIFPGIGLGVKVSQARKITEDMFYVAAQALANCVTAEEFEKGQVYPDITRIRYVSQEVAFRVADLVFKERNTPLERPANLREKIAKTMYYPFYAPLVPRPK